VSEWTEFATLAGSAAGALIGLLFVAVSIRVDMIAQSVELRARASQTLALFVTGLLAAIALAVPGQPRWVLGVELIALALAAAGTTVVMDKRAEKYHDFAAIANVFDDASPNYVTCLLLIAAGITLVLDHQWGLYLVVPTFVAVFVGGVISAWLFLTRLSPDDVGRPAG
jgi:hypothetical protein